MTHAFFGEPRMPRLSKLLREIKQGEILIPRFQRPFVWDDEKRLALVASVYSGYPIGAILVWRTQKHNLSTYENLGPLKMPQATDPSVVRQYLLDGHQRITTLFAALGSALFDQDEGDSLEWLNDPDERGNWPIYFDLKSPDKEPFRFLRARSTKESTWLPLDILLDPFKVNAFALELQKAGHDRKMINRVHSIAEKFRDYEIPVMPVATEDLEQVTVSFKRVNSGGSKMSEVHIINALGHAHDFDFLHELKEVAASLKPVGWEHFDEQMILNVCKAWLDIEVYRENAEVIANRLAKQPGILQNARDTIVHVAELLAKFGVRSPKSLPYSYQAVLLADALRNVETITDELRQKLYKWFWATTLTEYFRGMTNSLFERARQHLHDVVEEKSDALSDDMREIIVFPRRRFDFRHARSKGVGLLLAEQKPRALHRVNAQAINGFDLLGLHGVDALSKLVKESELDPKNRFLANGPENRFLIEPQQSGALQYLRAPQMPFPADTLMSHAVEEDAVDALAHGDLNEFLASRARTIENLEKSRAEACGLEYRTTSELDKPTGLFW